MRRLLLAALASLAVAVSGLAVTAPPASAEGEPVISTIDVSTPGHAKGTVTTTAPYVAVGLRANGSGLDLGGPTFIATAGGSAAFDEETWGLTSGAIAAQACTSEEIASCGAATLSPSFTPLDVVPVVTWPEDTTIGTGQVYAVTVTDGGGGTLATLWEHDYYQTKNALDRTGPTQLPLIDDGEGDVTVLRCSGLDATICRATGVTHHLTVNRYLPAGFALTNGTIWPISPTLGTKLKVSIHLFDETNSIAFEWHITRGSDGATVPGIGGEVAGLTPDVNGNVFPELDVTGLGDNDIYRLVGRVHRDTADFGRVSGEVWQSPQFRVDGTVPVIASIVKSASTLYPAKDGYRDSVKVTLKTAGGYDSNDMARLVIVDDSTGVTVRTLTPYNNIYGYQFLWNGRFASGVAVPAGSYTLLATVDDWAENHDEQSVGKVTVVRKKIAARTFRKTVSPAGTMEDKYVGSCSTLRKPSLRGWAGSLGYYTNTKCHRTFKNSLVVSVHALRTPAGAVKYGDFRVSAYGGAAKAAPLSDAFLSYANRSGNWVSDSRINHPLRTHDAAAAPGSTIVFDDRFVVWRAYTNQGAKYDIKNFTVRLKYWILVPE